MFLGTPEQSSVVLVFVIPNCFHLLKAVCVMVCSRMICTRMRDLELHAVYICVSDIGLAVKYTCFHVEFRIKLRCLSKSQSYWPPWLRTGSCRVI